MKNEEYFSKLFASEPSSRTDKVTSLGEAIGKNLNPGMSVFLGWNANAAVCEIMRRYQGGKPGFTLVMSLTWDLSLNLVHGGLIKRIISGGCSYPAPGPAPSHVIQRAYREGKVEIENWTLYSMQQRLMAGALGVGFMPTRSIAGSDMAMENSACFKEIADPFDSGRKIGAVKALNTDIAIVHALAADRYGNTIMSPVSQDTLWGPRSARGGVIVTAEKIVGPEFIRRHAHLVSIPGYLVRAVSLCPLGAHPEGHFSCIEEVDSYGEDYDFMLEQKKVSREPDLLNDWLKQWIYDVRDHEEYTGRIGFERIFSLKHKINTTQWENDLNSCACDRQAGRTEKMIIAASRVIAERVKEAGYKVLLAGIGIPGLASWIAYYRLKQEGVEIKLILGSGVFGYQPGPGDPNSVSVRHVPSAEMLIDTGEMYGFIISGEGASCLSIVGTAQIDEKGNINTTRVGADTYISGSGGNNDNTSGASEVMVVMAQSKKRCVERLDYLTSAGDKVSTLITDMGVFRKGSDGRFILTDCIPAADSKDPAGILAEIQDKCGWKIKADPTLTAIGSFDERDLALLRMFDPHGHVSGG